MLNSSDIVHGGLRDVYQTRSTAKPPPSSAEWRPSHRRLVALNVATIPAQAALPGYGLRPGQRKGYEFGPLPTSGGVIEFDWVGVYAQSVDWR
jgi:hypothetical protein